SSLLVQDYGLIDVYDARDGGGFPPPPLAPASCEGEACQSPPPVPDDPTPASSSFEGAGNVAEKRTQKRSCRKGSRRVRLKGKARCVSVRHKDAKRHRKNHRRADSNRGGAR
ncbi:MAG TPA: hypothetical protein VIM28_02545, partial [Solirubrobacterales bacterium]